jgi:diadenosine tetraphosphatase ApaH/serine/threonine PP2A family protein phosphatase
MARVAIISDIHSNLAALEAVVDDVGRPDAWWCMGDIVGYGPDPNQVIDVIQQLGATCIRGNHDDGVQRLTELAWFNSTAGAALEWTARELSEASWEFLRRLPHGVITDGVRLVHGSPRESLTEYVTNDAIARASFGLIDEDVCLIGHTHIPSSFVQQRDARDVEVSQRYDGDSVRLDSGARQILNAGSVGQPRDGDARAAYGILDTSDRTFTWHRVAYDVEVTQERMRFAALPTMLIERLSEGW